MSISRPCTRGLRRLGQNHHGIHSSMRWHVNRLYIRNTASSAAVSGVDTAATTASGSGRDAATAASAAVQQQQQQQQKQQQQHHQNHASLDATPHPGNAHARLVFPHPGSFKGPRGRVLTTEEVFTLLSTQVSQARLQRLRDVARGRSFGVVPIVEGLHDVGNVSAVCRSADAMGLGAVHAVVPGSKLKQSKRTTAGAEKWLDVRLWDSTRDCLSAFRSAGYQIVTTHLSAASVNIQDVDWTKKTAFVLGNERDGVSDTAIEMADAVAVVPMAGFVESFNVSVAAALIMWEAQQQRLRRLGRHGDLSDHEADILLSEFLVRGVREPALLIDELIGRGVLVYDRQTPLTAGGSGSSSSGRSSSSDGSSSSSSDGLAAAAASAAASAALKPRSSWADWVGALEGGGGGGDSSSDEA